MKPALRVVTMPNGYTEYKPSPGLQPYIACYWSYLRESIAALKDRKSIIPDGCSDIIFNLDPVSAQKSFVVGAMTHSIISNRSDLLGVRFKPGMAYPFLKTHMHALTDKIVNFDEFFGNKAAIFLDQLMSVKFINEQIVLLDRLFTGKLSTLIRVDAPIEKALRLTCHTSGKCSVEKISSEIGWSRQHFARKCLRYTGLTPKSFSQVIRIDALIKHFRLERFHNWSELALEAGFYDQAHMIHDFKKITGYTPLEFFG